MKSSLDEFVSVVDRLISRLDELESRVAALEHRATTPRDAPIAAAITPTPEHPLAQLSNSSRLLPAFGRVFLGIAGAYVLRAMAESGALPHWAIAALGLVYVFLWLLQSARSSTQNRMVGAAYAITAAVIFSPMLWELTLRFRLLSANSAAAVLALFVLIASALGWRRRLAAVAAVPAISAIVLATVLFVATRTPLPFILTLTAIAAMTEIAAHAGRWPGLRILPAIFVDLALVAAITVYLGRNPATDYQPIAPGLLLAIFVGPFVLYGLSAILRTVAFGREIGVFDVGQTVAAFLLASFGSITIAGGTAALVIGVFCFAAAAGCYALAFARFHGPAAARNYRVFSAWAAGFLLAGSWLCFSGTVAVIALGSAAVVANLAGARWERLTLAVHGVIYTAATAASSGLLAGLPNALLGDPSASPGPLPFLAGAFTLVCYATTWFSFRGLTLDAGLRMRQQILRLAYALLAVCGLMFAGVTAALALLRSADPARVASARTLVICVFAIVLGWLGARLKRAELAWLAYAAIALCTVKLLFEDLRAGSAGSIAFSLFCYGMCWLVVPRFSKSAKPA